MVVNIDINDIQYNLDRKMEVAEDLGFDIQEMESLGADLWTSRCTTKLCYDPQKLKAISQFDKRNEEIIKIAAIQSS